MRLQSYVSSIVWHKQFDSKPCTNHLLLPHHATRTGSQKGAPCTYIWCIMHLESLLASAQQNAFKTNDNAKQHIILLIMRTSFSVDVNGRSNERVANCRLQVRLFVRSIANRSHLIFSWLSMYPNWIWCPIPTKYHTFSSLFLRNRWNHPELDVKERDGILPLHHAEREWKRDSEDKPTTAI